MGSPRQRGRRRIGAAALAALLGAVVIAGPAAAASRNPEADAARDDVTPQRVIVRFREPAGRAAHAAIEAAHGEVRRSFHLIDAIAATVPANALNGLRRNPLVESVEFDHPLAIEDHVPARTPGQGGYPYDYEYNNAWGVSHIGADDVHDAGVLGERANGTRVKVAVIDTGIDYVHDTPNVEGQPVVDPEFSSNYAGGVNLRVPLGDPARDDPMDDHGHGTHVAGIIAAERNGYLVVGVAPEIELYGVKILDAEGNGEYSDLIAGLEWSVDNGMDVVNMSVGAHDVSQALADAVAAADAAGLLMVAAAGNTVTFWELIYGCPVAYPGAYPQVLAVTFTNPSDTLTGLSCTGPQVDLAAPGDQVASPVPVGTCAMCSSLGYAFASGTSMAAPHVTGTVALLLAMGIADAGDPGLFDDVRAHLCSTAHVAASPAVTDPRYANWYGCGIVDANHALLDVPPPPPGGENRPPVANDDPATTAEDTAVDIDVRANDTDLDGDLLGIAAVGAPANGTASTNPDGTIRYVPAPNYHGLDAFTYTVEDGQGGSDSATVTVTVSPVNDPPAAVNDSRTTPYQTAIVVDVLANDTDVDGDTLAVGSLSQPVNGTAAANGDGTITYTPNAGFSGVDAFTYIAIDGQGGSAGASVSITVGAAPPPPVPTFHVGDLDNASVLARRSWTAKVTIRIESAAHAPVGGVVVTGGWSAGASGSATCTTKANGTCTVQLKNLSLATASVTFTVTGATLAGWSYLASANHDPDPAPPNASSGTSIVVLRPS